MAAKLLAMYTKPADEAAFNDVQEFASDILTVQFVDELQSWEADT